MSKGENSLHGRAKYKLILLKGYPGFRHKSVVKLQNKMNRASSRSLFIYSEGPFKEKVADGVIEREGKLHLVDLAVLSALNLPESQLNLLVFEKAKTSTNLF